MRKDLAQARTFFKRALMHDAGFIAVYHSWGRMEALAGHVRLAAALLKRGLDLEPRNSRLLMASALLEDALGNPNRC